MEALGGFTCDAVDVVGAARDADALVGANSVDGFVIARAGGAVVEEATLAGAALLPVWELEADTCRDLGSAATVLLVAVD